MGGILGGDLLQVWQTGKRRPTCVGDWNSHVSESNVLSEPIFGLLNSGASRSIIGNKGSSIIPELGLTVDKEKTSELYSSE